MTDGKRLHILHVEDNEVDRMAVQRMVKEKNLPYDIDAAGTLAEGLKALESRSYDMVIIDYMLPNGKGLDLLEKACDVPAVFISGSGSEKAAVSAMKRGACDYLIKDPEGAYMKLLPVVIENALKNFQREKERKSRENEIREQYKLIERAKKEWEDTFDSISDPLFVHDADFRVIRANSAYAGAAGMPFKELIGKPYYEVFPKMDGPFSGCLKALELKKKEEEITPPLAGRVFRMKYYPLENHAGRYQHSLHVMEDITDQMRSEEKLMLHEARLQTMLDLNKMIKSPEQEILGFALDGIIKVTRSRFSFIGLLNEDESRMSVHSWSRGVMEECNVDKTSLEFDVPKGGLWAEAIRQRKTIVVNDYESAGPGRRGLPEGHVPITRFLGVPVFSGRQIVGIGAVANKEGEYDEGDIRALTTMLYDAWRLVRHKQAEGRIKEERNRTSGLLRLSEAVADTSDMDGLTGKMVQCVREVLGCDAALLYLFEAESGLFRPARAAGLSRETMPLFRTASLDENMIGFVKKAMKTGRHFVENLGGGDLKDLDGKELSNLEEYPCFREMQTLLCLPILVKGQCLGLLLCLNGKEKKFTENDTSVIRGISRQISTALDNAKLYKDLMDKTMELSHEMETIKVMNEIDKSILSVLDREEMLETAVRLVGKVVPADMTEVLLADRDRAGFIVTVGSGLKLKKGRFFPFEKTLASEVLRSGRMQYIPDLSEAAGLPALESRLLKNGLMSIIRMPLLVKEEIAAVLCVGSRRASAFTPADLATLERLAAQIGVALENARLLSDMEQLFLGTVKSLSSAIDAKSPWTAGHSERVTAYALLVGEEMGLSGEEMKDLELAGLLHDIGKIGISEAILDKPGRLTDEEFEAVKKHPGKGADMLAAIKQLRHITPAIRYHHENYDGTGYPEGLKGEAIPLLARILTVADTYDSMRADRPYRTGRTMEFIVEEFSRCSGTQFDPKVVNIFLEISWGADIPAKKPGEEWPGLLQQSSI